MWKTTSAKIERRTYMKSKTSLYDYVSIIGLVAALAASYWWFNGRVAIAGIAMFTGLLLFGAGALLSEATTNRTKSLEK